MLMPQLMLACRRDGLRSIGWPSRLAFELLQGTLTQHWPLVGEPSLPSATTT